MSFLAQLRHKQTELSQGLKLCYLFEVDPFTRVVQLKLRISDVKQGQLIDTGKPYHIQQQHIQNPPPFMAPTDANLLDALIKADSNWRQQDSGYLPINQAGLLLPLLIDTQRCYINTTEGVWNQFSLADPVSINLQWIPDHSGKLHLKWQTNSQSQLLYLDQAMNFSIAYDRTQRRMAPTEHCISATGLEALPRFPFVLSASGIDAFLLSHQEIWSNLRLPLPTPINPVEVTANFNPVLRLTSGLSGSGHKVKLMFRYVGEDFCICISKMNDIDSLDYWDGYQFRRLSRDLTGEQESLARLQPFMDQFKSTESTTEWQSDLGLNWQQLLIKIRPVLEREGFQFSIANGFRYHYITTDSWQVDIKELEQGGLQLGLLLSFDGEIVDLFELLSQLHRFNQTQFMDGSQLSLSDGRLLLLPAQQVNGIMSEFGDLLEKFDGGIRLPLSQVNRLDGLRKQLPDTAQWQGELSYLERASNLHQTPAMLSQIFDGVEAELRPYQWLGVCWLQHLRKHQINGLLADDMGLGKTLQTLAHLGLEQQRGALSSPALIVVPTSLLHNWAAELRQFTPQLKFKIVHGSGRQKTWGELQNYDVLISSYQLMVNDLERWQNQKLSWIILDEAHLIKNSRTQISRALRQLQSDFRLCLSGTPVQNHLAELWSLLDFLNPGCLDSYADFRRYYQKPIEQDGDQERMSQLQKRIAPFLLRRTKDQVAQDLPAKTEIDQHIILNEDQRRFYEKQVNTGRSELQYQLSNTEHSGQKQILLLTMLLKLRQSCCDPELLGVTGISSAKREHCIDMIEELVEEKRAILVFSQFTSMLDLLAQSLDKLDIKYLMLTGKSRNRQQLVDAFQRGEAAVFLISLKAGGVGLNLTAADTVIHFDPWWNIAAQQQATDRAHRIGQDRPVFVYKLIAKDTIEEKIALMQQHKAQISQQINQQAQLNGREFALKLEDLMSLWEQEISAT
ncbi:MAG: superfamily II DNA or RNA helicase [Gammaproteobacteria bacterium]|jgi:superfamily II DNA or RNA helicase